jgi:hypothetical protein
MTETGQAQTWKGTAFTIEREDGKAAGTVIFRLRGPLRSGICLRRWRRRWWTTC